LEAIDVFTNSCGKISVKTEGNHFYMLKCLVLLFFNDEFNFGNASLLGATNFFFFYFFLSEWTLSLFKKVISISIGFYHYREK